MPNPGKKDYKTGENKVHLRNSKGRTKLTNWNKEKNIAINA